MSQMSFAKETFDGIWANAVLHHIEKENMTETLTEWNRVLKLKGIIFITTKMGENISKTKEDMSLGEERQFTLLMPEEIDNFLESTGFEKVDLYTFNEKERVTDGRDLMWIGAIYRKIKY